jgi:hypothetical protein
MASRAWKIVVPDICVNRPQEPAVFYNYKAINTVLNLLSRIPLII